MQGQCVDSPSVMTPVPQILVSAFKTSSRNRTQKCTDDGQNAPHINSHERVANTCIALYQGAFVHGHAQSSPKENNRQFFRKRNITSSGLQGHAEPRDK